MWFCKYLSGHVNAASMFHGQLHQWSLKHLIGSTKSRFPCWSPSETISKGHRIHTIPRMKAKLTEVKKSSSVQMCLELLGNHPFNDIPPKREVRNGAVVVLGVSMKMLFFNWAKTIIDLRMPGTLSSWRKAMASPASNGPNLPWLAFISQGVFCISPNTSSKKLKFILIN